MDLQALSKYSFSNIDIHVVMPWRTMHTATQTLRLPKKLIAHDSIKDVVKQRKYFSKTIITVGMT